MEDDLKKQKMEDDLKKNENGRRPHKKMKMEDELNCFWKSKNTLIVDTGRRPQFLKIKDDLIFI